MALSIQITKINTNFTYTRVMYGHFALIGPWPFSQDKAFIVLLWIYIVYNLTKHVVYSARECVNDYCRTTNTQLLKHALGF